MITKGRRRKKHGRYFGMIDGKAGNELFEHMVTTGRELETKINESPFK